MDQVTVLSKYLVTPYVGLVPPDVTLAPGAGEVARLVILDAADLLAHGALRTTTRVEDGVPKPAYSFTAGGVTICGATARILKRFLEVGYGVRYRNATALGSELNNT